MLENVSIEDIKEQFKKNNTLKYITYGVGIIIFLVIAYFLYRQFIILPKEEKSQDAYWAGMNFAKNDSTEIAIDELNSVVKKYDGYSGGEIAQFVLGRQLMNKGEFQQAIEKLEDVDIEDTYVRVMSKGLLGDCYSELKQYQKAASAYLEAANLEDNNMTTPMYLFKAGLCAEELNNPKVALENYQRIKDNYRNFSNKKTIDKYIARVETQETE